MIQVLTDMAQAAPASSPAGTVSSFNILSNGGVASFKSVMKNLQTLGQEPLGGATRQSFANLLNRLSGPLQSLEDLATADTPSVEIEAAIGEIITAMNAFQAETGTDLTQLLTPLYGPGADAPLTVVTTQTSQDAPASDVSGLITFVNLVNTVSQAALNAAPSAEPVKVAIEFTQPKTGEAKPQPQAVATALANLAVVADDPVTTTQAAVIGKAAPRIAAAVAKTQLDQVDVQIAMAFAQTGADKNRAGVSMIKAPGQFVASVAQGQIVLQTPIAAFVPVVEPWFSDALPQDRQAWVMPAQLDAAPTQSPSGTDVDRKPTRFANIILDQIKASSITEGQTKVELSPRGLGNIEIEVTTDADGATNVVIRADNNQVLNALRDMREPWTQVLGFENGASFSFEDMSQGDRRSNGDGSGNSETSDIGSGFGTDPSMTAATAAIIAGGQLDLMT